jgi:predicted porin
MKQAETLVALGALTVASLASAQSSVVLFGVVDAAVSGYKVSVRPTHIEFR